MSGRFYYVTADTLRKLLDALPEGVLLSAATFPSLGDVGVYDRDGMLIGWLVLDGEDSRFVRR